MDGNFYGTSAQVVGAKSSPGTYAGCPERGWVHLAEAGIKPNNAGRTSPVRYTQPAVLLAGTGYWSRSSRVRF